MTFKSGRYQFLLFTIPIVFFNYFIRASRWRVFVRTKKKVSVLSVFWANIICYMDIAFLQARAGESLRSAFLGDNSGLGTSIVLVTALAERVLDAIALVLIGSISIIWLGNISPLMMIAVRITALIGVLGLGILIIAPFQEKLILCVVDWLTDAIGNMIGVHIISQSLTIGQALILLAALGLSSAIPSTPGSVGVYQFVALLVIVPFGFSQSEALVNILISQVLGYIVISFWGLIGLWQIDRTKKHASECLG
jgi:glycosyltransferase 2 family protein